MQKSCPLGQDFFAQNVKLLNCDSVLCLCRVLVQCPTLT